jgi:hypothetical protein
MRWNHLHTRWALVACLTVGLAWVATPAIAAPQPNIDICHIPPDDPDAVRTIHVPERAAANHIFKHGDFEVGLECSEGVGECEVFGDTVCVAGDDVCTASALKPPPEPTEVSCDDGLDNDCDGAVDGDDPDCSVSCPCQSQYDAVVFVPLASQCGTDSIQTFLSNGDGTAISDGIFVVTLSIAAECGWWQDELGFPSGISLSSQDEVDACFQAVLDRASAEGVSCN